MEMGTTDIESLSPQEIERLKSLMALPKVGWYMAQISVAIILTSMFISRITVPWLFLAFALNAAGLWCWQVWYREFTPTDTATRNRGKYAVILSLVAAIVSALIQFGYL